MTGEGEVMSLVGAVLVYKGAGHTFVTVHEAICDDASCELSSGTPLTREGATKLLDGLDASLAYRGLVPENLLAISPGVMVWCCPPSRRTTWFESKDEHGMGVRHGLASHPGLVFAAAGDTWYVFAVKGDKRPTPDTQLCRAPYFNVWADRGEICVGNVRTPDSIGPEAIQAYERAFFESRFTHPNPGFKVRFKGGGFALWRALLDDAGRKPFPHRALVPAGLTLAQFVRRLTGRKHHAD